MAAVKPYKLGPPTGPGVTNTFVDWDASDFLDFVHGGVGASYADANALLLGIGGERVSQKNANSGYAGLDVTGKIAKAQGYAQTVYTDQSNVYTDGAKQSFVHGATNAGLRLVPASGDPSTQADGDVWYNSASGFWYREAGSTKPLTQAGGGGGSPPGGSATHMQFNATGTAFGGTAEITRQVYGGNNDVRLTVGTTGSTRGNIRLVPFAGDIAGADVQNGDLWYNSSTGRFMGRAAGVTTPFGVTTDSVGLIPTDLLRPRSWDRSQSLIQSLPSETSYQTTGLSIKPLTMGSMAPLYDANGSWIEHTSGAASGAGAGIQSPHYEILQPQWKPEHYFQFRLPSDFSTTSANYWFGLFSDALCDAQGNPAHGSMSSPTGLSVAAIKFAGAGSVFTSYTCAGSTGTTTNNSTGITLSNGAGFEGLIRFMTGKIQFWINVLGAGMVLLAEHTTNIPSGSAWLGYIDGGFATGAVAIRCGLKRFYTESL